MRRMELQILTSCLLLLYSNINRDKVVAKTDLRAEY
jgi:hypothetical protein